jgi:hypothetical protein
MYGQYRSLILEDENANFIFGTGNNVVTASNFWVLSVERARYKQSLFPGSINLKISGSGGVINLTDNSLDSSLSVFIGSVTKKHLIKFSINLTILLHKEKSSFVHFLSNTLLNSVGFK